MITSTLKLHVLEIDVTKEVSLGQLRKINDQIGRLYEDSNAILARISLWSFSARKIIMPKGEVPTGGYIAFAADTEGNAFGIFQGKLTSAHAS